MDYKIPTKNDLREVPRNKSIEATIVNVEVKTWRELISDVETLKKFSDPDAPQLLIKYDAAGFIREEKFTYMENPTTTSRLGKFIVRYDAPVVGSKIQVDFDTDGKSEILLAK